MLKKAYLIVSLFCVVLSTSLTTATPAYAACVDNVFGITTWYRGLPTDGNGCSVKTFDENSGGMRKTIMVIALNIVQAAMAVAAYVTLFYIIKGGFAYMTSTGSPDGMSSAKKTITNAVIGLIIALLSASIVNAIAGVIK